MSIDPSVRGAGVTRIRRWPGLEHLPPHSRHSFDYAIVPLASGAWVTVPVKRAHDRVVSALHDPAG